MRKKIKDNLLSFKEAVVLVIVVSFITSAITGFLSGGLAYDFVKNLKIFGENGQNLISLGGRAQTADQDQSKQEDPTGNETGSSESESIVNVVEKVSPAVVSIIVSKDMPVLEEYYQEYNPFGDDDFLRQFFGDDFFSPFQVPQYRQKGTEKKEIGGGTGFIVSGDGLILTNKHVVSDEKADYTVLTNEGEKIPARVLARDPIEDIAILKIDKGNLPMVKLGNSDNIKIGQTAVVIGNALGEFRNTVSVGVISGLRRSITAGGALGEKEYLSEVIQTDAAINPGNSGGPLLNLRGEAIGINVAMAQDAENIGFSLPINKAKRDLEQVKAQGKISYPFLGVRYLIITPEIKKENNLSIDYGALIVKGKGQGESAITPGSPAEKSGLEENDIILELNGAKINQDNLLADLIQKYQVGEKVRLKILHKGEEKIVEVELAER